METRVSIYLTIMLVTVYMHIVSATGIQFVKKLHGLHPTMMSSVIDNVTMATKNMCGAYCTQKSCRSMLYHEPSGTCTLFSTYKSDNSSAVDTLYALNKTVCDPLTANSAFIGTFEVTGIYSGDTARYTCSTGYRVVTGDAVRTCGVNGQWNGTEPIGCELIDCGVPEPGTDCHVIVPSTVFNSVATYTCKAGYYLLFGQTNRTCGADGKWSDMAPHCLVVSCPIPDTPANSEIGHIYGVTYGEWVEFRCRPGYMQISGDPRKMCGSDSRWIGTDIICVHDK